MLAGQPASQPVKIVVASPRGWLVGSKQEEPFEGLERIYLVFYLRAWAAGWLADQPIDL